MAHTRQSRPDSGLGFEKNIVDTFQAVLSSHVTDAGQGFWFKQISPFIFVVVMNTCAVQRHVIKERYGTGLEQAALDAVALRVLSWSDCGTQQSKEIGSSKNVAKALALRQRCL